MEYSVVILSGGKSSRMGSDKGSLMLEGKTFIEVLVNNMSGADEILLSTGENDIYDSINVRHIHDEFKNCGPVGGIHRALTAMRNEWLFAVACDMPCMDYAFAEALYNKGMELNSNARVIVPVGADGKRHMLGALYHKSIADSIAGLIEAGERRLQSIAELFPAVFVPILGKEENKKLMNVNTGDDYKRLLEPKIPVISFVGYSKSGKTTLIEKLIRILGERGFETAYIKHTHHEIGLSGKKKDNERMFETEAKISAVISENSVQWLERTEPDINEILEKISGVDLIVIEGYKKMQFDKVAVVSPGDRDEILQTVENVRKTVGPEASSLYDFSRDNPEAVADWLIREVINRENRKQ